ncbi:MAG: hypothetical protein PHX87_01870 [Candidatus Peribacteraceae bacterium]|nr:hypothetical protein [Candidatus Peribacteraceae bacterium]MDD5742154.1 hypothetical protein [Candidatus Peribacteraceae bacterium]
MAKHHDGLGVPACLFNRDSEGSGSKVEAAALHGGLGVPPEHLYPELSPEEARKKFHAALAARVPAEAEGEG